MLMGGLVSQHIRYGNVVLMYDHTECIFEYRARLSRQLNHLPFFNSELHQKQLIYIKQRLRRKAYTSLPSLLSFHRNTSTMSMTP